MARREKGGGINKNVLIVCVFQGYFGLASAALAFAAECVRHKLSGATRTDDGVCKHDDLILVPKLGLVSALPLLFAQIIITSATKCYCCVTRQNLPSSNQTAGLVTFVLHWVAFLFAFSMLLGATIYSYVSGLGGCSVIEPGIFAGAGILVLATVALGVVCHISLSSCKNTSPMQTQNPEIAMAHRHQSQRPAMNNQPQQHQGPEISDEPPVGVHEDTYRRRQYTLLEELKKTSQ